jgi:GrpB-like predicted nucleotidyltransferase (UPF0157 family)
MCERVEIFPYDPAWPRRFEAERLVLADVFAGIEARIEHVGSTAVPGLGAKPIVDIMLGVANLVEIEQRIAALEAGGYRYVPEHEAQIPERRYLRKPRLGPSAVHLHCVVTGSAFWVRQLAFRDYLRAHPEAAADYDALKRGLALRLDRKAYTDAKGPFIEGILVAAGVR